MNKKVQNLGLLTLGLSAVIVVTCALAIYGLQKEAQSSVQMIHDDLSQDLLNSSVSSAQRRIEILRRAGHYGLELIPLGEDASIQPAQCLSEKTFPVLVDGLQIARLSNCITYSNLSPMIVRSPIAIMIFSAAILILLLSLMMRLRIQRLKIIADKNDEIANLAYQVAHDIQSPLSALNNLLDYTQAIPEKKKILLKHSIMRINDISNSLSLKKFPAQASGESFLLFSEIDILITSKRLEKANNKNISIGFTQKNAWNLFSSFDRTDLRRIISNLLNNSIEAISMMDGRSGGKIQVTLEESNGFAKITIKDDGPGIPEAIESQLGSRKVSFGKAKLSNSGSGIGVYHAKTTVDKAGGTFVIQNSEEGGAIVELSIPIDKQPTWFMDELNISAHCQSIVILDDDKSIHSLWESEFHEAKSLNPQLKIVHFAHPREFEVWKRFNNCDLVLCDYEFSGSEMSGIEVIKKFNLNSKAVLSTSHFDEVKIQNECNKIGIKMIPKLLIPRIKIRINSNSELNLEQKEMVLLDDDDLVRANWDMQAKAKGANLKIFSTSEELLNKLNFFDKNTLFFIDNRLGQESGVDVARKVHLAGYTEIYIQTGDDKESFPKHSFIRGVLGKSPEW